MAGDHRRPAAVPASSRRARHVVALAVSALVYATVLLAAISHSRNLAWHLEGTQTKQAQMVPDDREKHNHEMMSNLATMLSKNTGDIKSISYKVRNLDGTDDTELTITMKDDQVQPPRDDNHIHTEKTMETAPTGNDEPAPAPAATPRGEAMETHKPWRLFSIPGDHVLVVGDRVGDEITVHIRPPSASLEQHAADGDGDGKLKRKQSGSGGGASSQWQQQAAGSLSLYDCGPYGALFLSPADKEGASAPVPVLVPVPWPAPQMFDRVTTAVLEWKESPLVMELVAPESFTLSPGEVVFYRPAPDGAAFVLLSASEDVEHVVLAEEEAAQAVRALAARAVVSTSFRYCPDVKFKRNQNLITWFRT